MKFVQNPLDMRDLLMDDYVPFQSKNLGNGVYVDVFKMPIGILGSLSYHLPFLTVIYIMIRWGLIKVQSWHWLCHY